MLMNKKPLKIIADPFLFYGGLIAVIFCFTLSFYIAFFVITPDLVEPPEDTNSVKAIFIFLGSAMVIAGIISLPRWLNIITFDKEYIKFKTPFHKEITEQYHNYQFVYVGYYSYLGFSIAYIVLSKAKMSNNQLENIEQVKADGQIIKIKYSDKALAKLQPFLTEKQNHQLNKQLNK